MINQKFLNQLDVTNDFLEDLFNTEGLDKVLLKKSENNPLKKDIHSFIGEFKALSMIKQIAANFREALTPNTTFEKAKDLMDDVEKRISLTQTIQNIPNPIEQIAAQNINTDNEDYIKTNFSTPSHQELK